MIIGKAYAVVILEQAAMQLTGINGVTIHRVNILRIYTHIHI